MSVRADRSNTAAGPGAVATPSAGGQTPAATSSASANGNSNSNTHGAIGIECLDPNQEERAGKVREVGSQAIWSLSSCKPGFGVDQLRDDCMDTYWQSDGQLPHLVNIQFRRKTTVKDICIFSDYKLDESYTPSRISIRAGTNFNDLQEVEVIDINEPTGWVMIPVKDIHEKPIRTFMIQIAVISNHQNGRDTHMRQIKIHSPIQHRPMAIQPYGNFVTLGCQKYSCIR